MYEWQKQIQIIVDEIGSCIKNHNDDALTLSFLSYKLGYSEFYTTRKFKEISGMQFRDYLRNRRLALALKAVRDSDKSLLDIAVDYGFSSHEAFTRAFKGIYGVTPSEYRKNPKPVTLRTKITIPAHKFLHVKNYDSDGYWDFWQKQALIPGHDCETICGLLDSIKGKLDDEGGSESNSGGGQIMAYIHDPEGKPFRYNIPHAECYGVRLPFDYKGEVPSQMIMMDVPEAEYIVFEHGSFNYEQENQSVQKKIDIAIATFDFAGTGYRIDTSPGRIAYFYHDPARGWKNIRPVRKIDET